MGATLLIAVCSLLMLAGLAGVVLPVLPGMPLAWLGLFVYALVTGFETIPVTAVVVFFVVMAFAFVLDFLAPGEQARHVGRLVRPSRRTGCYRFLGHRPRVVRRGAALGELIAGKRPELALRSAWSTLVGFVAGTLLRVVVVLTMIGFFIASFFQ